MDKRQLEKLKNVLKLKQDKDGVILDELERITDNLEKLNETKKDHIIVDSINSTNNILKEIKKDDTTVTVLKDLIESLKTDKKLTLDGFQIEKIKGDNGKKGDKGDKGDSVKREKGDTIKCDKGDDGKDGYIPIKGKDYFTNKEIKQFKTDVTPIKDIDYFDGKDGKDGIGLKGEKGNPPKHEYKNGLLRFEKPDGNWGKWIDLKELTITMGGRTLHRGGANYIDSETPTGTINGVNTSFTLANTPVDGSLKVYLNGARQKLTDDYTLSGKTINFITAPETGSNLLVDYRY